MPCLPFDVPVYRIAGQTNSYAFDDRNINYEEIEQAQRAAQAQASLSMIGILGQTQDGPDPLDYGTNLYLQIALADNNNVSVQATNVQWDKYLELLSKTDLVSQVVWTPEQEIILYAGDPHDAVFTVSENGRTNLFFWAVEGSSHVGIDTSQDRNAIRPSPCYAGRPGIFTVHRDSRTGQESPLTVWYQVSGSGTNGLDYTNVSGSVTIEAYQYWQPIEVDALPRSILTNQTVTITLLMTNDYVPDPMYAQSATILIEPNVFSLVANVPDPVGLDYHTLTHSLLVSVDPELYPSRQTNFLRIATNGVVSHWADVTGLICPVTIATVKTSTNGFVEGDMYFGTTDPGGIGWLSANGVQSNIDWVSLSGYLKPVGGLYVDQTGVFGGDLIATTGGDYTGVGDPGSLWRINWTRDATQVASFDMPLGGVITLTNDVAQWGPWAGKIITGQAPEPEPFLDQPEIYAINTNGQITTHYLRIQPEQFNLIPPNQPFYCCDSLSYAVWKVPAAVFTNHVGQLLITGMGLVDHEVLPALFIVRWDAGITNFVIEKINTPDFVGCLEDGTFAPIDIPCLPQ